MDQSLNAPDVSRSARCLGALEITSQNGSAFEGTYVIECSGRSSGTVLDGRISPGGRISFRLRATEGWGPGLIPGWFTSPCQVSADSETYEGSVTNGSMAASRTQTLDCLTGRVVVTAAFQGSRH